MNTPIPEQAITAACDELDRRYRELHQLTGFNRDQGEPEVRAMLYAAAPHIIKAAMTIPSWLLQADDEVTPEQIADWKAKWAAAQGRPAEILLADDPVITPNPYAARVAELEQLAADIIATFTKTDAGYRARVGQVQIAKWETTLKGRQ